MEYRVKVEIIQAKLKLKGAIHTKVEYQVSISLDLPDETWDSSLEVVIEVIIKVLVVVNFIE